MQEIVEDGAGEKAGLPARPKLTKKSRVGSPETKPVRKAKKSEAKPEVEVKVENVEPARGFYLIEAEKDAAEQAVQVEQLAPVVAYNAELAADLAALWNRIWLDETEGSERDDVLGEMVHNIALKMRGGSKRKAKNGDDPFKRMSLDEGCPVEAKQLRRLGQRWECILAARAAGEVPPKLGVSHYAATQRLSKNLSKRLEFLRDAVAQKMSVARLKAEVKKFLGDPCEKPKNWRQKFCDYAYAVTQEIFDFSAQLEASGKSIRAEEKTALCAIRSAIDRLLGGDNQ